MKWWESMNWEREKRRIEELDTREELEDEKDGKRKRSLEQSHKCIDWNQINCADFDLKGGSIKLAHCEPLALLNGSASQIVNWSICWIR